MQRKKYYYLFSLILILAGIYLIVFFLKKQFSENIEFIGEEKSFVSQIIKTSEKDENKKVEYLGLPVKEELATPISITEKIQQTVPFITQAPFATWKDQDFQNGCEEASIVMAMAWTKDEKIITPTEAKKEILDIIEFENKTLGYSADTDITDIIKIFHQYFKYENAKALENIALNDIKNELKKGNLLLVPAYGRALENPNFTQPGPITHMLLIIGYDPATKQFITNDPGTRKGANYRYNENIFFDAIWNYPSGKEHPPIPASGKMPKAMISVGK